MEFRHLKYFAVVAEELHFRKSAEKLFISQPPLSRQIQELEKELDAQLFIRSNKRVELTEAGKYLKREVGRLFNQIDKIKTEIKHINQENSGQFRIGYISSTYHKNLMQAIHLLNEEFPLVRTQLFEASTIKQVIALEQEKLEIGIMRAPVYSDQLEIKTLFLDPFVLVTNKKLPEFKLEDFRDAHFIFFNKDYAPDFYSKLLEICNRSGFSPEVMHEVNNVHSILKMVANNMGVSILPKTVIDLAEKGNLFYYEIKEDNIYTEVVMAWKRGNKGHVLQFFADNFGKMAENQLS